MLLKTCTLNTKIQIHFRPKTNSKMLAMQSEDEQRDLHGWLGVAVVLVYTVVSVFETSRVELSLEPK